MATKWWSRWDRDPLAWWHQTLASVSSLIAVDEFIWDEARCAPAWIAYRGLSSDLAGRRFCGCDSYGPTDRLVSAIVDAIRPTSTPNMLHIFDVTATGPTAIAAVATDRPPQYTVRHMLRESGWSYVNLDAVLDNVEWPMGQRIPWA